MQSTLHYNFPLYEGEDSPNLLVEWNGTMQALDTKLYALSIGNAGPEIIREIEQLITAVNGLITEVTEAISDIDDLQDTVNGVQQTVNTLFNNIDDIQDTLVAMQATVASVSALISALQGTVTQNSEDIESLQNSVSTLTSSMATLNGALTNMQASISTLDTSVTSLDTRVTALENQPAPQGGGLSAKTPRDIGATPESPSGWGLHIDNTAQAFDDFIAQSPFILVGDGAADTVNIYSSRWEESYDYEARDWVYTEVQDSLIATLNPGDIYLLQRNDKVVGSYTNFDFSNFGYYDSIIPNLQNTVSYLSDSDNYKTQQIDAINKTIEPLSAAPIVLQNTYTLPVYHAPEFGSAAYYDLSISSTDITPSSIVKKFEIQGIGKSPLSGGQGFQNVTIPLGKFLMDMSSGAKKSMVFITGIYSSKSNINSSGELVFSTGTQYTPLEIKVKVASVYSRLTPDGETADISLEVMVTPNPSQGTWVNEPLIIKGFVVESNAITATPRT